MKENNYKKYLKKIEADQKWGISPSRKKGVKCKEGNRSSPLFKIKTQTNYKLQLLLSARNFH